MFGMRGRGTYHLSKLSVFRVHPDTFSDTGGRKLAAVGDFYRKMVISRQFKQNLRLLILRYRLEILKEGKKYQVTSFRGVSENLDSHKLVYYTKKRPILPKNL